jgi:hypothetical protein
MAVYYGTNVTAEPVVVSESKDTRMFHETWIGGGHFVLLQTTVTTVVHYEGVSLADARALEVHSESSTLNSTTRPYLGGATVTANGIGAASMECGACWGTRVNSSLRRMGLSSMYEVDVTTEVMSVSTTSDRTLVLT